MRWDWAELLFFGVPLLVAGLLAAGWLGMIHLNAGDQASLGFIGLCGLFFWALGHIGEGKDLRR